MLAMAAAVFWALWSAIGGRPAFVVKIARGEPRVVRGPVTRAFLQEVREVCTRYGVDAGRVRGVVKYGRISLEFSDSMPPQCRQQLRNVWVLTGWSAERGRTVSR
jgi:hypothetical protein